MKNNNSIKLVRECISKISDCFYRNAYTYFCESDLQSYLFALLLEKFGEEKELKRTFVWGTDKPKKVKKEFFTMSNRLALFLKYNKSAIEELKDYIDEYNNLYSFHPKKMKKVGKSVKDWYSI